jgi:hypothetical protein
MTDETQNRRSDGPRPVNVVAHTHWDRKWESQIADLR